MEFSVCCSRAVATPDPWNSKPNSKEEFQGSGIRTTIMGDPFTLMDLFVWQPVNLVGNLDVQRFQCSAVSRNSTGAASSIPVFTRGPTVIRLKSIWRKCPQGVSFVKSAQLVGDHTNWFPNLLGGFFFYIL